MAESVAALYDRNMPIGVNINMAIHDPIKGERSPSLADFSPMVEMI